MLPPKTVPQEFVFVGGPSLTEQSSHVRSVLLRRVLNEKRAKRRQDAADRLDSMLNLNKQEQAQAQAQAQARDPLTAICTCDSNTGQGAILPASGHSSNKRKDKGKNKQAERCPTCGKLVAGQQVQMLYLPDPQRLVTGRRDPLLPVNAPAARLKIHELLDFATSTIWARFRRLDYAGTCYREWVLPFESNLQLYATLWAASYHRDILRITCGVPEFRLDSKEQLELKLLTVRALQREVSKVSQTNRPDALVMCILYLAVNDQHKTRILRDPSPFSPPFVSLQMLDFYGSREYHPLHWDMVQDIVRRFGGIETLQAFALPWLLTLAALMRSAQTLTKPIYPIVGVAGMPLNLQPPSLLFQPHGYRDPLDRAGSGFHELFAMWPPVRPEVVQVLTHLGQYSRVVQHYSIMECSPEVSDLLGDCRNLVHHRLLSLPNEADPAESYLQYTEQNNARNDLSREIYLTCHLSAVLFAAHVTFPFPRTQQFREMVLTALGSRYDRLSALNASGPVVLWCIAIGISMAGESSPKSLISYMAHLLEDAGVGTMEMLIGVLQRFAWVDSSVRDDWKEMWTRWFFSPKTSVTDTA